MIYVECALFRVFFVWKDDSYTAMSRLFHDDSYSIWRHQMETFYKLLSLSVGILLVRVNSPHWGQWRGAFVFSLICAWLNGRVNNREAGDLRHHRAHYDVIVILMVDQCVHWFYLYYYVVQDFACGCPVAPQLHNIGRHIDIYIYIYMQMHMHMYVCIYLYIFIYICVCIYLYEYKYIYIYIWI